MRVVAEGIIGREKEPAVVAPPRPSRRRCRGRALGIHVGRYAADASVQSDIWLVASFTHNVDLRICGRAAVMDCRLHSRSRNDSRFAGRAQPQLPADFLLRVAAFADGSGAAGARSIDTRRPAVKRYTPGQGPLR